MTFTPGTRLGPYEILSARDLPGLGEVYDARDHDQQRNVAFRVLRADFAANPDRLRRFEQDAHAAAQLANPNILTVHDVGTDAQAAYVVSEPMEGRTLREVLDGGALPIGTAIPYAVQIAQGLAAAHEKGIVHQDLKPENVLIGPGGGVRSWASGSRPRLRASWRSAAACRWARWGTCHRSRCAGNLSISAPICLPSARSSTRCSRVRALSPAVRRSTQ